MIVDIIPGITRILISISWGHVSEEVKSHIELYDSVKDTLKPVLYAASAWLSWIILFQNIFKLYNSNIDEISVAPYTDRVSLLANFNGHEELNVICRLLKPLNFCSFWHL